MLCGGAISWASKMQRTVATSSAESEYVAASDACHEALFLRRLVAALFEQDLTKLGPTPIYEDNAAALKWCENPVHHAKQKHIDVAHHFVREQVVEFKTIKVLPIESVNNISDIGTKPLAQPTFERLLRIVMNLGNRSLRTPATTYPTGNGVSVAEQFPSIAPTKPTQCSTAAIAPRAAAQDAHGGRPSTDTVTDIAMLLLSVAEAVAESKQVTNTRQPKTNKNQNNCKHNQFPALARYLHT